MMESSKTPKQRIDLSAVAHTKLILHSIQHSTCTIHGILLGTIDTNSNTSNHTSENDGEGAILKISNVLPVFHSTPTKPLLDMSLKFANAYCHQCNNNNNTSNNSNNNNNKSLLRIVGWYTSNAQINQDKPNQAALKIIKGIADAWATCEDLALQKDVSGVEPVLACLTSQGLEKVLSGSTSGTDESGIDFYGADSKQTWMELYSTNNIINNNTQSTSLLDGTNIIAAVQEGIKVYDLEDHLDGNDANKNDWIHNESVEEYVQKVLK